MSFILDALKRAERERRLEKAPDLSAVYEEDLPRHRKTWIWGIVSGVALFVVVLGVFVLGPESKTEEKKIIGLNTERKMATAANQGVAKRASGLPHKKTLSKDVGKNPAQTARPIPVKRSTKKVPSNASKRDRASKRALIHEARSIGTESSPTKKGSPSSVNEIEPGTEIPGRRETDLEKRLEPAKIREVVEDDGTFENDSLSPPQFNKSAQKAKPESKKPIPLVSELPDDAKESLSGLQINIHVYAEDPEERLVFINMRNRKVGDRIGEKGHVLKEITPNGVIIDYGKGQALLRVGR